MDNFLNIDEFKEKLIQLEDGIIEEKSYLFNQIKKLEGEEHLLRENLTFFEKYLNILESGGNIAELR
jgi:hypothetical protein